MQSSENCDETPRCSNICAAEEDATQAGIQYHTTSATQSSVSAGSADLTAAINRAIQIPALAINRWALRDRVADGWFWRQTLSLPLVADRLLLQLSSLGS